MVGIAVDERRSLVHGMWAAVAPRWADHADDVDERGAEMTQQLLRVPTCNLGTTCWNWPADQAEPGWLRPRSPVRPVGS